MEPGRCSHPGGKRLNVCRGDCPHPWGSTPRFSACIGRNDRVQVWATFEGTAGHYQKRGSPEPRSSAESCMETELKPDRSWGAFGVQLSQGPSLHRSAFCGFERKLISLLVSAALGPGHLRPRPPRLGAVPCACQAQGLGDHAFSYGSNHV